MKPQNIISLLERELGVSDVRLLKFSGASGDSVFQCFYQGNKAFVKVRLRCRHGCVNKKSFELAERLYAKCPHHFLHHFAYLETKNAVYQVSEWIEGRLIVIQTPRFQSGNSVSSENAFIQRCIRPFRTIVDFLLDNSNDFGQIDVKQVLTVAERGEIVKQMRTIAETLLAEGIIHGDIDYNLLWTNDGRLVVIDLDTTMKRDDETAKQEYIHFRVRQMVFCCHSFLIDDCLCLRGVLQGIGSEPEYAEEYDRTEQFLTQNIGQLEIRTGRVLHFSLWNAVYRSARNIWRFVVRRCR
jgi:hypothetical protein